MPDSLLSKCRITLFGIAPEEACLSRRGFGPTSPEKRACLENAGKAFIQGYLSALRSADPETSAVGCETLTRDLRGFAYEGSAMGLALIDLVTTGRPRLFTTFVEGPARDHIYMAHVGSGWAMARCPWGMLTFFPRMNPLLKWLAVDGLGFHEGYFHPARFISACSTSWKGKLGPRPFDNGLGRAMWFASGARAEPVLETLSAFPTARRAALWSGVGLAATYAGGASVEELESLCSAAGEYRDNVAQGAAFAAKARCRADNLTENTETACQVFCQMDAGSAAAVTDECLAAISTGQDGSYFAWCDSITQRFANRTRTTIVTTV